MAAIVWAYLMAQAEPAPETEAGYDGGFYIRSGEVRLAIEGLLQVNYSLFERDSPYESEFALRRFRLEFSGEFLERWLFHIEPKFTEEDVELEEAWIGMHLGDHRVMLGRMKEPFSLEEMASQRHMDPINFSILNQFVPAEDHGITVLGRLGFLEYGLGFYNGTGGDDTASDKDVAVRLVAHVRRGLQAGASVTLGRESIGVGGAELTTEARVAWAEFVDGAEIDGRRTRMGAEVAWLEGPFAVTAEVMRIRQDMNGPEVGFTGGYVQASWVVTGEAKTWKGVVPTQPFLKEPALGAWQVLVRWSRLDLHEDLAPLLTTFPERIDSLTLGVNWYANEFVKLKLNALRTVYREEVTIGGDRHEGMHAVLMQAQLDF